MFAATPFSRVRQWIRALRVLVPALIVALPPLFLVREACYRSTLTTLGRDQGIFQYIGWAITQGEVDYRDIRDVNGPLTHLVHVVFLWCGGRDEHRFHVLDLVVTATSFAIVGACLPGLFRTRDARLRGWLARFGWALAACITLTGQYLLYLYWDLMQRESIFDWFLLPAIGLQLVAQRKLAHKERAGNVLLALSGLLSVLTVFGKPTYALFTITQLIALAIDHETHVRLRSRIAPFLAGCALGTALMFAFLLTHGDVRAFAKIYLVDVPNMYRFMMPRTPGEILSLQWGGTNAAMSAATSFVLIALIVYDQMPRRALVIAVLPLVALVNVILQGKGFPYHFHPVTAGLYLQWLTLAVWTTERFASSASPFGKVVPLVAAAALAIRLGTMMPISPHIDNLWILQKGVTEEQRAGQDYFVYFRGPDYFPWEMREGAAYLKEHTSPTDRVQLYGMDPYILFLAERRSATPYIYAYDLNADGALYGSWLPTGLHPNEQQKAVINSLRDEHEADMLDRLQKSPPAAFVFIDKAPLTTYDDSATDFKEHCPKASAWVGEHYRETAAFGEVHVWMRNELADAR
jgi:hypothetical protein